MTKTFDQSLIDTANIPMSMIDPEDMADTTSEEFKSLRRVQQGCHSELTNREDFPFNKFRKTITAIKGNPYYSMHEGRITLVKIVEDNNVEALKYDPNISLYEDKEGKPVSYFVQYNPEKIKLYPAPDKRYNIGIEYLSTKNVLTSSEDETYEISTGCTLNMPERFQHLYFDALEYYVLATNMRKVSNPRWQPTMDIFKQKWATFLRGCQTIETETTFTI